MPIQNNTCLPFWHASKENGYPMLDLTLRVPLNDGNSIPIFGLGVFKSPPGKPTHDIVAAALELGYRHIDTAAIYGNEADVGRAIRESGIPREEIFVTTKLWNQDQGYDAALKACDASLARLGLSYVDLYLIHWPVEKLRLDSWKALCKLKDSGKARSIGVSNYTERHLDELLASSNVLPAVNQVEFSPFLFQKSLLEYCAKKQIRLEAYSPLTKGDRLADETISSIAKKYGKTPAQILIRWCIEHEIVVIPKTTRKERLRENAGCFDFSLSREDVEALDSLNEDYRTSWDPTHAP